MDENAAILLSSIIGYQEKFLEEIGKYKGQNFRIIGPAGGKIKIMDSDTVMIVADSAIERINGIIPQIIVTDLDGNLKKIEKAWEEGSIVVVHAHGDNMEAIKTEGAFFKGRFLGTCQSKNTHGLLNLKGFTDGDRSVKLAQFLEAGRITLDGFDFSNPVLKINSREKKKKLDIARYIILDVVKDRTGKNMNTIPPVF